MEWNEQSADSLIHFLKTFLNLLKKQGKNFFTTRLPDFINP